MEDDTLKIAQNILAQKYSNMFIMVEDADGDLYWAGSNIFGEGASQKFLRIIKGEDTQIVFEPRDDDDDEFAS